MPRQPKDPQQTKRKKSTYGGGTVYQRKDGRYVASFKDPTSGKRIERYGKTHKEAEKLLEDIKFEIRQGTLATGPNQTVQQYLLRWFEDVHKYDVRETTFLRNRTFLKRILPAIGNIHLRKLTAQHVRHFYAEMLKEGMKPGSVRNIHAFLRKALSNAVRWNLVPHNVCDQISAPRNTEGHEAAHALTADQALHLLRVSRGHALEVLIALALVTGLRHGEIRALHWQDVDLEERTLRVDRTVQRIWGKGYFVTTPKTEKGKREIVLPQYVVNVLLRQRQHIEEMRRQAGEKWQENDLVFPNERGKYQDETHTLRRFHNLLEKAGLPRVRVHDLRHSVASLLILVLGMPPKLVQEMLGHSDVEMTLNIYTHADKSQQRKMMDAFDQFLGE
jgi:integrase